MHSKRAPRFLVSTSLAMKSAIPAACAGHPGYGAWKEMADRRMRASDSSLPTLTR